MTEKKEVVIYCALFFALLLFLMVAIHFMMQKQQEITKDEESEAGSIYNQYIDNSGSSEYQCTTVFLSGTMDSQRSAVLWRI